MNRDRARQVLGVSPGASATELRRAYWSLMRRHHPDVVGNDPDTTAQAAALASAYSLLMQPATKGPPDGAPRSRPPADDPPSTEVRTDGVVIVEAPGNETFLRVLDALETIGDVTYRDRSGGYLQAIVQPEGGPLCTMVVVIEPRSIDTVVLVSLDSMENVDAPPIEPVLHELARLVAEH